MGARKHEIGMNTRINGDTGIAEVMFGDEWKEKVRKAKNQMPGLP